MNDKELKDLIEDALKSNTESVKIEFKDCREGLHKQLWKAITAFANSPGGGIIVLGVNENPSTFEKKIVGGLDLDKLQENVISLLVDNGINQAGNVLKSITNLLPGKNLELSGYYKVNDGSVTGNTWNPGSTLNQIQGYNSPFCR